MRERLKIRAVLVAAVLAAHLALLPLLQSRPQSNLAHWPTQYRVQVVVVPNTSSSPMPSKVIRSESGKKGAQKKPASQLKTNGTHSPQEPRFESPSLSSTSEPGAAVTATISAPPREVDVAASQPLRLGNDVLRRAAQSARSEARGLVEADAASRLRTPMSRDQRFEVSVREAGKPGCLQADATKHESIQLGGLLGLPVLVHAIASGRCR